MFSQIDQKYNARNWTSSYRDQKAAIKRCKWKGVDVSDKGGCKWWNWKSQNIHGSKNGDEPNIRCGLFQHHRSYPHPLSLYFSIKRAAFLVWQWKDQRWIALQSSRRTQQTEGCVAHSMLSLLRRFTGDHWHHLHSILIEMVFRKSQFSESVANLQKENVRDSFEAPPELPEGWEILQFLVK